MFHCTGYFDESQYSSRNSASPHALTFERCIMPLSSYLLLPLQNSNMIKLRQLGLCNYSRYSVCVSLLAAEI
jgi:hypothetical protein